MKLILCIFLATSALSAPPKKPLSKEEATENVFFYGFWTGASYASYQAFGLLHNLAKGQPGQKHAAQTMYSAKIVSAVIGFSSAMLMIGNLQRLSQNNS